VAHEHCLYSTNGPEHYIHVHVYVEMIRRQHDQPPRNFTCMQLAFLVDPRGVPSKTGTTKAANSDLGLALAYKVRVRVIG